MILRGAYKQNNKKLKINILTLKNKIIILTLQKKDICTILNSKLNWY